MTANSTDTRRTQTLADSQHSAGQKELIEFISKDLDTTKADAALILESVTSAITNLTSTKGGVRVPNLGHFRLVNTSAREGRNPRTGESVTIPPGRRATFRAAKAFRNVIGG